MVHKKHPELCVIITVYILHAEKFLLRIGRSVYLVIYLKDELANVVTCFTEKAQTGTRIVRLQKNFQTRSNYLSISWVLVKYRHTGITNCKKGSGRPVTAMTDKNLAAVEQHCQSQDDKPGTHNSQRQAACTINGMSRRLVQQVLKRCGLHPFKRMRTSAVNVL